MVTEYYGHPIPSLAEHNTLYDQFLEDNTKDAHYVLQRSGMVPLLVEKVKSQVAKQLVQKKKEAKNKKLLLHKHGYNPSVPHKDYYQPLQQSQKLLIAGQHKKDL